MDTAVDGGARLARRVRGAVLVGLSALLTAVGHLAGGGAVPDLALLVVLLPLLGWPVVAVADRCRGPLATAAVLGAGQFLPHQLMVAVHGGAHSAADHVSAAAVPSDATMLAGHAAATLLMVFVLRHADRGVAAVAAALRRVVPRRCAPPRVERPLAVRAVPGPAVPARLRRALAVTHVRRGPPVCC
jgi:hypothetical protein